MDDRSHSHWAAAAGRRLRPLAAAAALAWPALCPARAADVVELKAFVAAPPTPAVGESYSHAFRAWIEKVNAATKGRLTLTLVDEPDVPPNKVAAALARGTFDVLHAPARYYVGAVPEGEALVACNQPVERIRANGGLDLLNTIWHERLNAHVLAWLESNMSYAIYTTRRPRMVDGRISLDGLTMRTTATLRDFFSALGAEVAATSASDIAAGLDRGSLQGFGMPTGAVRALGITTRVKYRVEPTFYRANNLLLVNLDTWNRLGEPLRETLIRLAIDAEAYSRAYVEGADDRERRALATAGVESVVLDGAARRDFLATANDVVWERLSERAPETVEALKAKFYVR